MVDYRKQILKTIMNREPNWQKIKKELFENFVEPDFLKYAAVAFPGVDFDKGLEIFRYILEEKLPNYDETKSVFEKLRQYFEGQQKKDVLAELISMYEPFLKKLFEIKNTSYTPNPNNPKPIALGWCYNKLFHKLSIVAEPQKEQFYDTEVIGKIAMPKYESNQFESNFLTDSTPFGKALHSVYHTRNSNIHNNPSLTTRQVTDCLVDTIHSYLYFTFKYYDELSQIIPQNKLQSTSNLSIKDLASLSGGAYNPDIENEVKRDNIIQTIENKIRNFDVLFIEGEEGIGKTTILHQFIAKHPNNCFSYFIDSKDSNTYTNLSILKAFCNQIHFFNKGYELEEEIGLSHSTNEDWLKNYLHSERIRKGNNQIFYFIIDGLDEIIQDRQNEIKELILDKLPYDKTNIKLLLSGRQNKKFVKRGCDYDKYEISFLSKGESFTIFGNEIDADRFEELNEVCQNNAGRIVFFRDLIKKKGINVNSIIGKLSSDLKSIYQYVWSTVSEMDENCKIILAIIAFQDEKYSTKEIDQILQLGERKIIDSLQFLPFVKKNVSGKYEFIFDGFTDFARTQLGTYKKKIDGIVIEYLLRDLDSVDSLIRLPELYKKTGRKEDLMALLTNTRWKHLLIESEKISVMSRVSNVALDAIQGENDNKYIPTILKYSVLKSALKELSRTTVWQYEIAASLVLEDYMEAQNLANIAFLKEDKLKKYASIARAYTERQLRVPNDIQRNIQELYDDIDASKDFKNIRESAVEIASLLMYSNPKLAFRLIEDLSGNISDNDNAFDWALAQISLSVHSNLENLEDVSKEDINTKVYSKIRNPKIKEFADAIIHLSENQTYVQIIESINQLESTSQKLFLIRNWIGNNQKDDNVAEIVELGLKLIVDKSDRYVPKSSDYKIFAMPLPYLKDKDKAYELTEKIEQYTSSIEASSGTNDLLTIKLFVARTLCNFEFEKGEEKLLDIYTEIQKIPDLALRCTCFAIYANEATRIANTHQDRNLDLYLDTARNGIISNIDSILKQTALHFEIVHSIITNLVRLYPNDAIEICRKLNKSIDRDNAFLESLATYFKQSFEKVEIEIVDELLNSIVDIDIRKIAITEIINRLEILSDDERILIDPFYKYFETVDSLFDNRVKCLLYVKIISILQQNEQDSSNVCEKLNQTWHELEKSVYKIELGFEIAYHAAFLKDQDLARRTIVAVKEEKDKPDLLLDSPNTTEIFSLVVELAIRVFSGLISQNNFESRDIESIERLISSLPSEREQIRLWSSLILRVIPKSKTEDLQKRLIADYIVPKLSKIQNRSERISAIMEAIVVLYFNDKNIPNIDELPNQKLKDIGIARVIKYLTTKCLPDEVCDSKSDGYAIDHSTVEKILELTNLMENDYFISHQIINIRQSILSKDTKISSQKKIDIRTEFEKIANSKLPDLNNIKHLGYQLLVKANALAIQTKQKWEEWAIILDEVEKIPNLSDRIFMWDSIAELLPDDFLKEKKDLINKAVDSAYSLPSYLDTVGKIEMIFFTLNKKNITGVGLKPLLENFIKAINNNSHSPFLRENYKNILDVAHSTDPEIAKALVNSFDRDSARLNTGAYLNNHLNLLEFQSKLNEKHNASDDEQKLLEGNPFFFNKVIEKKLALLNASKSINDSLLPKNLIYQLKMASEYSIFEGQNAYSYFIERLILAYENTSESKKTIRNSFLELIDVCNIVKLLSIRNADKIRSLIDVLSTGLSSEEDRFQNIENEISAESQNLIINLLSMGKTEEEVSSFLSIDIDIVKSINDNI